MIDDSDGNDMALMAVLTDGPIGWVFLVVAIVFWVIAASNKDDCSKLHCDIGSPMLVNHECICQVKAK